MKKKNVLLLFFVLIQLNFLFAQETFSKRMDLGFPAVVFTSIETNDSCYYVTGIMADSIFPYRTGILFSKFNMEGDLIFAKTLVDSVKTYESWENTLTPLEDGNFFLSGFSSYERGLLMKFTPQGDTLFVKKYKSPYFQENPWFVTSDLVLLPDGGMALFSIVDQANFDNDMLLIRTDSLGNLLWEKVYGGNTDEAAQSIISTEDGGFILGAGAQGGGYLIKTDSLGEIEWEYSIPSSESINPFFDLHQLGDGSLIVASAYWTEVSQGLSLPNNILLRINLDQEILWSTTFKDTFPNINNRINKVLPLPDNEHFLAVAGGVAYKSESWQNVGKLIKASYEGDSIWTRYYHHVENQSAQNLLYDLEATPDGGFIMCGQAKDTQINPTEPNQQGWLLKVDEHGCLVPGCQLLSSVDEVGTSVPFQLKLYPNPATEYLNIYFHHASMKGEAHFSLRDAGGKVVKEFKSNLSDVTHVWAVDDLVAGVYWLTCRVGDEVFTEEVVVG